MKEKEKKEFDWFDKPSSKRLLWILLLVTCGLTLVAEPIYLMIAHKDHHAEGLFKFTKWPLFYAVLGFVSCALMIVVAKVLGFWLKKPTDHYEKEEEADD
ncbi:MAG: flagellar basal body-associated protein FliL [Verrucomicrobiales bacterium]|jgi:flagellar basal body-associated protein FliL